MAKSRSRVADYLVYLTIRVVICFIQALPYELALRLAEGLAWVAYRVDRRHRLVAEDNLNHAFPGRWTDAERTVVVKAVYRHFLYLLVEIIFLNRKLHATNWRRHLEMINGHRIVDALLSGRPLFLVTAHFGNWELGGSTLGLLGFPTYAIARELDNSYLENFLRTFRSRNGQGLLSKSRDFDKIQSILARQGVIATLGDQDAGQKGCFVDFFNRPASTHRAIALLSLEQNVPLLVVGLPRVGKGLDYHLLCEELIDPEEYRDRPDAVAAMTQRFTTVLERMIRQYPEQYFWLHRRWKHQPKARKGKQAA